MIEKRNERLLRHVPLGGPKRPLEDRVMDAPLIGWWLRIELLIRRRRSYRSRRHRRCRRIVRKLNVRLQRELRHRFLSLGYLQKELRDISRRDGLAVLLVRT